MLTIAQFVSSGIKDVECLKQALQLALRLEFSTIPPYLCAEWSINTENDPDHLAGLIKKIVIQEMNHFALAGNILAAIRGKPSVGNSNFLVNYPTNTLPGNIKLKNPVDLAPYSKSQMEIFMEIEYPQFPPVAVADVTPTIGDFYDIIKEALFNLKAQINIDSNAFFVPVRGAPRISSVEDAALTIDIIKREGEGAPGNPYQGPSGSVIAHYYTFKEMALSKKLQRSADGTWGYNGPDIRTPQIFQFSASDPRDAKSIDFNRKLTLLLEHLEDVWTKGLPVDYQLMGSLRDVGVALVTSGLRPEFAWMQ